MQRMILMMICFAYLPFTTALAQAVELKPAPSGVSIDGSLTEWGDELPYSDKNKVFSYLISYDRNNLYLIVKTRDSVCQGNILGSGITFSIKAITDKVGQRLTFPLSGKEDPTEYMNLDTEQVAMKTTLVRYKRIGVQGFAAIKAEQLTTTNPYGIKTAVSYAAGGCLIYEEAIPLKLIYPDGILEKRMYSVKINGLARKYRYWGLIEPVLRGKDRLGLLNRYLERYHPDGVEIGGPSPITDFEKKLTADVEVKGEFIIAL
jgi:hypothetical protein